MAEDTRSPLREDLSSNSTGKDSIKALEFNGGSISEKNIKDSNGYGQEQPESGADFYDNSGEEEEEDYDDE